MQQASVWIAVVSLRWSLVILAMQDHSLSGEKDGLVNS